MHVVVQRLLQSAAQGVVVHAGAVDEAHVVAGEGGRRVGATVGAGVDPLLFAGEVAVS